MAYTYCITHKSTGRRYYGARWARNACPEDLWSSYFTSSPHIQKLVREQGPDAFLAEVRRTFDDAARAKMWEHKVLRRLRAVSRSDWYNRSNGQAPVFSRSRVGQGKGRKLTDSHKHAISKGCRGKSKPQTLEHRRKGADARRGREKTDAARANHLAANRASAPTFMFEHATHPPFVGCVAEWAETYSINKASAITSFGSRGSYRGWTRQTHTPT